MRCVKCGKSLSNDWNYCPYCGVRVQRNAILNAVNRIVKGFFNNGKFTIRFVSSGSAAVKQKRRAIRLPENVVEPESSVSRVGDELIVTINLPGVKSGDFSVSVFSNSLEVRAVSGSKGFFKIISLPGNYRVTGESLVNGKLSVRLVSR